MKIKNQDQGPVVQASFRKAYDAINRNLLFKKLGSLGICGRLYKALASLYENVSCCVKLNGFKTDWFTVTCGNLSTILFIFLYK